MIKKKKIIYGLAAIAAGAVFFGIGNETEAFANDNKCLNEPGGFRYNMTAISVDHCISTTLGKDPVIEGKVMNCVKGGFTKCDDNTCKTSDPYVTCHTEVLYKY